MLRRRIITSNLNEEFKKARSGFDQRALEQTLESRPAYFAPLRGFPRVGAAGLESDYLTDAERRAIIRSAASNIMYTEPEIIGPLFDPVNWFLPYTYKVLNRWIRYYDRFHPVVGNCIDMHSEVPLSRFSLTGLEDDTILREFEEILEELDIFNNLLAMTREWWLLGECFPFLHWNENELCFDELVILNPDFIHVNASPLAYGSNVQLSLEPDDALIALVKSTNERDLQLRSLLDPVVIDAVEAGQNIPLDNFNVSQLARKSSPYDLRGTSIVLRCLKDLLYEDKLREAQYAVADRHITPLKIFTLGDPQGEWVPDQDDIDNLAATLAAGQDDPNFALIGNYSLRVEYVGSTGKVLPIIPEFEFVERRILTALFTNKAMTSGEGPCYSSDTQTLTDHGWKYYDEIGEFDRIATFNPETAALEYHPWTGRVKMPFQGKMIHFRNPTVDILVTPNHPMWIGRFRGRESIAWEKVLARDVVDKVLPEEGEVCLRACVDSFEGKDPSTVTIGDKEVPTELAMAFFGWYLAEGCVVWKERHQVRIAQKGYKDEVREVVNALPFKFTSSQDCSEFVACDETLTRWVMANLGTEDEKRVPSWVKELHPKHLKVLLFALIKEDGSRDHVFYSEDQGLAEDVFELALKCGYAPRLYYENNWKVVFSDHRDTCFPTIRAEHVSRVPYDGWVYCFEVPNHLFITRRNGKIGINFNTFANASVAFEVLQMRYASLRNMLEIWLREKVFLPIAKARGYFRRKQAELDHKVRVSHSGKTYHRYSFRSRERARLAIPEINWLEKLSLYDDSQQKSFMLRLRERGDIPLKLIAEVFGWDYEKLMHDLTEEAGTVADPAFRQTLQRAFSGYVSSQPGRGLTPGPLLTGIPPLGLNIPSSGLGGPLGLNLPSGGGTPPPAAAGPQGLETLPPVTTSKQSKEAKQSQKTQQETVEIPADPEAFIDFASRVLEEHEALREKLRARISQKEKRKVFGPKTYGSRGNVFFVNEQAIDQTLTQKGAHHGDTQVQSRQSKKSTSGQNDQGSS